MVHFKSSRTNYYDHFTVKFAMLIFSMFHAQTSIERSRYFQAQGLMHVPTIIMLIIAPLNALFNYLLVWGPKPINIGFVFSFLLPFQAPTRSS